MTAAVYLHVLIVNHHWNFELLHCASYVPKLVYTHRCGREHKMHTLNRCAKHTGILATDCSYVKQTELKYVCQLKALF